MTSNRARSGWSSLVLWARVLVLCLFVQSALGCADLHFTACEIAQTGLHEDGAIDAAQEGDLDTDPACAHCHGSCVHFAVALQRSLPVMAPVRMTPEHPGILQRPSAPQHPLLRPPAALA